jgi:hypothetical protein
VPKVILIELDSNFNLFLDRIYGINRIFLFLIFRKKMRKANPTSSETNAWFGYSYSIIVPFTTNECLTYRRRRLKFAGFLQESLQKYPEDPVHPVQKFKHKIESIPLICIIIILMN